MIHGRMLLLSILIILPHSVQADSISQLHGQCVVIAYLLDDLGLEQQTNSCRYFLLDTATDVRRTAAMIRAKKLRKAHDWMTDASIKIGLVVEIGCSRQSAIKQIQQKIGTILIKLESY